MDIQHPLLPIGQPPQQRSSKTRPLLVALVVAAALSAVPALVYKWRAAERRAQRLSVASSLTAQRRAAVARLNELQCEERELMLKRALIANDPVSWTLEGIEDEISKYRTECRPTAEADAVAAALVARLRAAP